MPDAETNVGRVPPQNLDAECCVLGGILLRNDALDEACDLIGIDDFYHPAHRVLFEAFIDLRVDRMPIDVITVAERAKSLPSGRHGAVSETLLADLAARVPTAANIRYYAGIVREKARLRRLIALGGDIVSKAFAESADADDLIDEAQTKLTASEHSRARIQTAAELVAESTKRLRSEDRRERPIPTGYADIDAKIGGLLRRRLFVIGGRPGAGKSTFAQGIVDNLTAVGVPCGVISLEEEGPDYLDAQIGRTAEIDSLKVRRGKDALSEDEDRRWDEAARAWARRPLYVCSDRPMTMRDVCRVARQMKRQHGIEVLKIDYLGQLRRPGRRKEHEEIEEQLGELFACLHQLNLAGLLVSQLNRESEKQTTRDKRPRIHHLQGAGAIEQWAYCVMSVYRECMHNPKADGNIAEILIGKVKRGEGDRRVKMLWVPHLPAVRDLPPDYESPVEQKPAARRKPTQSSLPLDGRAAAAGNA